MPRLPPKKDSKPYSQVAAEYEKSQKLKSLKDSTWIPAQDAQVQKALGRLNEPQIIQGEDKGDRRDRLRDVVCKLKLEGRNVDFAFDLIETKKATKPVKETVSLGSQELQSARLAIFEFTQKKSGKRNEPQDSLNELETQKHIKQSLEDLMPLGSQTLSRPVSSLELSPDAKKIALGHLGGSVSVVDASSLEVSLHTQVHQGKTSSLCWVGDQLVSGGQNGLICVHGPEKVTQLKEHTHAVTGLASHPLGYLFSSSIDETWRMWDLRTETSLWTQKSHARGVSCIGVDPDGALVACGGLDGYGRVFDLRSGKPIMLLDGHAREIHSLDWSGVNIATSSADNTVAIWDLRAAQRAAVIPAHTDLVFRVKYSADGRFLASASLDCTIKFWRSGSWAPISRLDTPGKITCFDFGSGVYAYGRRDKAVDVYEGEV